MKLNSFSFAFELECSFCMFVKFYVDLIFLWPLCFYIECVYSFGKYTVHIPYLIFNLENYEKSFELRPERTNDLFEWQIESNNESLNKREVTAVNQPQAQASFWKNFNILCLFLGEILIIGELHVLHISKVPVVLKFREIDDSIDLKCRNANYLLYSQISSTFPLILCNGL